MMETKKGILTRGGHTSPDAMIIPLLRALVIVGDAHVTAAYGKMRDLVSLTEKDVAPDKSGFPYYYRGLSMRVGRMRKAGLIQPATGDNWLRITDTGRILAGYEL